MLDSSYYTQSQGDWTQNLLVHVKDAQDRSGSPYIPIKFSLEGPYGFHSVNFESHEYQVRGTIIYCYYTCMYLCMYCMYVV